MWEALCDTHPSFFGERVQGIHFRLGICADQMVMSRGITGRYFGMDWRPKKRKRQPHMLRCAQVILFLNGD